jgi:hypothetical protein
MSRENIILESDTAQTLTFATKKGDHITYSYSSGDWRAYLSGEDPSQLNGLRVTSPAGAVQLAISFAQRAAEAAENTAATTSDAAITAISAL